MEMVPNEKEHSDLFAESYVFCNRGHRSTPRKKRRGRPLSPKGGLLVLRTAFSYVGMRVVLKHLASAIVWLSMK